MEEVMDIGDLISCSDVEHDDGEDFSYVQQITDTDVIWLISELWDDNSGLDTRE